jgi:2-amino-4-hydroxy-6-hydroxymethyldihydropteridine diphosphokinase
VIIVGIGSNLAAPPFASPQETATAALAQLPELGVGLVRQSRWYESEPVPPSDQPWYSNAVAIVATALSPAALLARLLALENRFGRRRGTRDAARTLDLDLLDYDGQELAEPGLILPHPRLHERRFVLLPLAEVAPGWRHPRLGLTADELLARLPPGQPIRVSGERRGVIVVAAADRYNPAPTCPIPTRPAVMR